MDLMKKVEELVEVYYNSGQFVYSMMYLQQLTETPFELFERLAAFYEKSNYTGAKLSRNRRYEILWEFAGRELFTGEAEEEQQSVFAQILFFDYCLREKPKSRPGFAGQKYLDKQTLKEVYAFLGVKREEEGCLMGLL